MVKGKEKISFRSTTVAITANQVTLARIFLLPLPVVLLIHGNILLLWLSFALFVLLGATDFIDGVMARREGPTRLGSLLDPVADKIFVTAIFMSFSALGVVSSWVVSLILTREFLLTALRSSVAIRKEAIKTSVLGKVKTIVQMGGAGTIFFTIMLPKIALFWVCLALSISFFFISGYRFFNHKKQTYWSTPVGIAFLYVAIMGLYLEKNTVIMGQILIIVSLTWLSAIDYMLGTYRLFKKNGMKEGDFWRLFWAITYGLLLSPLVHQFPELVLFLWALISLEFLLGGIDNIVVTEKNYFPVNTFLFSNFYGFILLFFLKLAPLKNINFNHKIVVIIVLLLSLLNCAWFFIKNRSLFKKVF